MSFLRRWLAEGASNLLLLIFCIHGIWLGMVSFIFWRLDIELFSIPGIYELYDYLKMSFCYVPAFLQLCRKAPNQALTRF